MELIINAASQSSRRVPSNVIPLFEKDAAIGIVPYIQRGEAIPNANPQPLFAHKTERTVNAVFQENGDQAAQHHTQYPVFKNLLQLNTEIVPEVNGFMV